MARKSNSVTVSTMMVAASLFIGGACGSLVRLALSALQPSDVTWPFMTTIINLTGAFLLGFITAYMAALGPDIGVWRVTRLGLGTGLIGGYTTYSTFMLEVGKRIKSGEVAIAVGYLLVSIVFGLLCAMLGLAIGKALGKRRALRNGDFLEPRRGPLIGVAFMLFACVAIVSLLINPHWRGHVAAFGLLFAASLIGGLGAFARYSVDAWVNNRVHLPFPCGTIVVNLTACLAMGLVAGWCGTHAGLATLQYLLASGFLGGYSTFSTASVEGAKLVDGRKPLWAFVHTAGMMALCLAALLLGMLI
ncbi:CrcB family protein [Bifidobacterium sp. ESL0732]|uniref:fluoride efflux transporter FluC n=1 Tax=Bifidobacterium sp. ESL0732 TaxID=2983222 RepID=UPI0023F97A5F|nr:CrcB family protein [Bifidobacterium sp. ESL0732]WEV63651.1 CrcB family protein [Bifidobacterium sp. ESL0732]